MANRPPGASTGVFAGLRLAHKLTWLAAATSCLSMLVPCVVLIMLDASTRRQGLVEGATVLVEGLAANNSAVLAFGDAPAAAQSLQAFAGIDHRVLRATALLRDGTALASYDRSSSLPIPSHVNSATSVPPPSPFRLGASTLEVAAPVALEGERIGTMVVEFSLIDFHAQSSVVRWTLGGALMATCVIAWIVGWHLQRLISAPLLRLAALTRAVSLGPDYSVRAVRDSDDEIGDVVDGVNAMLDHIQARDVRLDEQRRGLERAVVARTTELAASVERFESIVASTQAIPWEADGESFAVAYISPQVSTLLACDSARLTGTSALWDMVHDLDRERVLAQLRDLAAQPHGSDHLDYRIVTADQRCLDVRTVAGVHRDEAGTCVLRGVILDVTEQRRLERDLQQAQKLESVGRLAAGVAHEINTPVQFVSDSIHFVRDAASDLTRLIGAYRGALRAAGSGTPTADIASAVEQAEAEADLDYLLDHVPKALARSLDGLNRVAVIVRSMKDFAHPDSTAMAEVDLNRAIESTLVIAHNEYKYVAEVETDFGDLPLVRCHGGEVNQVILNIIVNAAHAIADVVRDTDAKGRITVTTRREGDAAVVSIADTGGGVPEALQQRIFEQFFTTKGVGQGTGQGLAIARAVIHEKHGGRLDCHSEPGCGATFTIRLPIAGCGANMDGVAA